MSLVANRVLSLTHVSQMRGKRAYWRCQVIWNKVAFARRLMLVDNVLGNNANFYFRPTDAKVYSFSGGINDTTRPRISAGVQHFTAVDFHWFSTMDAMFSSRFFFQSLAMSGG